MKLDRNNYKSAMNKVNVSEKINQSLLQKSKDSDYERWLIKRACKEERKKARRWIEIFVIVFLIALYILMDVIQYNRFFNHLERDGTCVTAQYNEWHNDYEYHEKGQKGYAVCQKSILFKNQGDDVKMYYLGDDISLAVPLLANWVWIAAYEVVGSVIVFCIIFIIRQVKRLIKNKI